MELKKILGLDLGVSSIGWAVVVEHTGSQDILDMGSRVIPIKTGDKDEFSKGNKISKNQSRTAKRTQRKGYDRYQLRRKALTQELLKHGIFDEALFKLPPLELWGLRAKAVTERVSLQELGRLLYHLNQKRGYKSSRSDANLNKKDTEYVAEVKNRHQEINDAGITIGQKFFLELQQNEHYRIKQQVFPREAYQEEFDSIMSQQQQHYTQLLTNEFIKKLRNEIIYFQRKLKSQKGLVNVCEFEKIKRTRGSVEIWVGPKVAPRSSPLFQVCKIWETINNIKITPKSKQYDPITITLEQKRAIFEYLDSHPKLHQADLFKLLGLPKNADGWEGGAIVEKGLQGNTTKTAILEAVKGLPFSDSLLEFNLNLEEKAGEVSLVDKKTGEVTHTNIRKIISPAVEEQPLFRLWHTIYSIADLAECANALMHKFGLNKATAEKLAALDFTKSSFGNKSTKAMRKIVPYLMDGYLYSEACTLAGYNHSNSLTKDENQQRELQDTLKNLPKNSLRQPVVEQILNQMINVVNAIIQKHGSPDEIRVELARELKQSTGERNDAYFSMSKTERENKVIQEKLQQEYHVRATRNNVIKWRLFQEITDEGSSKVNATCIYCNQHFGITDALKGNNVDVEHIIPKSLLFDDSQSNKTLSHRSCNEAKGNQTAFDFMQGKGAEALEQYLSRIKDLYGKKLISKTKRNKLLMPADKIPQNFIDRQIRETQYIARKATEILTQVCRNVQATGGSVTAHLRNLWGWDEVLMNLQLPKYREQNLTEREEWQNSQGQLHQKEKIIGWTKRDDHRHHAIDALVIACTKQGFIQRINTLSSKHTKSVLYEDTNQQSKGFKHDRTLLDNYLIQQRPFTTKQVEEKAAEILISFKAGKKVATIGNRKVKKAGKKVIVQSGIIVPRGALNEESVYGKIKTIEKKKPIKYIFENPHLIFKPRIKLAVEERIAMFDGNAKKALESLKKAPIYLDLEQNVRLEYATCFKEEYVLKYPIENIEAKDVKSIIDGKVQKLVQERFSQYPEKEAFKEPLYLDTAQKAPIRTIRMVTGLSSVEPIKTDEYGNGIGFVKPGNNHHIALYTDENGKKLAHGCTFWHAVERKKHGLPVVIKKTAETWDLINTREDLPKAFCQKLPSPKWNFDISLQQNEMFVLGLISAEFEKAIQEKNKKLISRYLYRVQKISITQSGQINVWFRMHLETSLNDSAEAKQAKRYYNIGSIGAFERLNPQKVRIDHLGQILL